MLELSSQTVNKKVNDKPRPCIRSDSYHKRSAAPNKRPAPPTLDRAKTVSAEPSAVLIPLSYASPPRARLGSVPNLAQPIERQLH